MIVARSAARAHIPQHSAAMVALWLSPEVLPERTFRSIPRPWWLYELLLLRHCQGRHPAATLTTECCGMLALVHITNAARKFPLSPRTVATSAGSGPPFRTGSVIVNFVILQSPDCIPQLSPAFRDIPRHSAVTRLTFRTHSAAFRVRSWVLVRCSLILIWWPWVLVWYWWLLFCWC